MSKLIDTMIKQTDYSFYCCMHAMSARKRKGIYVICAFAKYMLDIASGTNSLTQKLSLLNAWRKELDNIYKYSAPTSQIGRDIYNVLQDTKLPQKEFLTLLDNVHNELQNPSQKLSEQQYGEYCNNRAGIFICQTLRVLGCEDERQIKQLSDYLGKAVQTTLVLRDVKDDAADGRIYMPLDYLHQAGIESDNPKEIIVNNNLSEVRSHLGKFAEDNYDKAFKMIECFDKKTAFHLKTLIYPYKYCFDVMNKRGWEIISPKPDVTAMTKVMLLIKAYMEKIF